MVDVCLDAVIFLDSYNIENLSRSLLIKSTDVTMFSDFGYWEVHKGSHKQKSTALVRQKLTRMALTLFTILNAILNVRSSLKFMFEFC